MRVRNLAVTLALGLAASMNWTGSSAREPLSALRTQAIAAQGYVYGFPILLMNETIRAATSTPPPCGFGGPVNVFKHIFEIPDQDFRAVVRPNVDTLYSSAFLNLKSGPVALDVPKVKDRFYLLAMLDAWTNNFAGVGTQTNNGKAGRYIITGPDWQGKVPSGYEHIKATTDLVWIIGRTEVRGNDDIKAANAVQRQYRLSTVGQKQPQPTTQNCVPADQLIEPKVAVRKLDGPAFFEQLDRLVKTYPPSTDDARILSKLAMIGVGSNSDSSVEGLSPRNKQALTLGAEKAQNLLTSSFDLLGKTSVWSPNPQKVQLGDYGTQYLVRAVVSQIGFGANRNEFAVYQNAQTDEQRAQLSGKNIYTLAFKADNLPPVDAFWSVTVYDKDGFLVKNDLERYALGNNSGLKAGSDGSVAITFASKQPDDVPSENWLPTPEGPFEVTLRLYAPRQAILDGSWKAPAIVRAQ